MSRVAASCVFALVAVLVGWPNTAAFGQAAFPGAVTVHSREELVSAARAARPGTRVLIAPGEYGGGLMLPGLRGTEGKPIVLAALDERNPPVFVGGGTGIHLTGPSHVELRGLVVRGATGNGVNIDDGGDANRPARGIVLRGLRIHDIGPKGNRDGVKLSGVVDVRVESCVIERWGEGGSAIDMVGCHRGEIAGCRFAHRDDIAANGVQTKGGSSGIVIRQCRFEHAGSRAVNIGGSTGRDYFRPRDPGHEARDITVEHCTFLGSMAPIAFVGVDGATVRYNTIYRPTRWVARILQESMGPEFVACREGRFTNNLVVFRSDEARTIVNVGGGTAPETFTFAENHWYCLDDPRRSDRLGLPVEERGGVHGVDPGFVDAENGDLRLRADSPARNVGARAERSAGESTRE